MSGPRMVSIIEAHERTGIAPRAPADIDVSAGPLAVRCRTLVGGLAEGVRMVELVAGKTRLWLLPDRGLGIWKVNAAGMAALKARMPFYDLTKFEQNPSVQNFPNMLTVEDMVRYVQSKVGG